MPKLTPFTCKKCKMHLGDFFPSSKVEHKRCGSVTSLTKDEQRAAKVHESAGQRHPTSAELAAHTIKGAPGGSGAK